MPKLRNIKYLVKDSHELARIVSGWQIPESAKFLKVDVDDFYMSGKHDVCLIVLRVMLTSRASSFC